MKNLIQITWTLASLCAPVLGLPNPFASIDLQKKADSSKVGYLAVYWTTTVESVYLALSNNNSPLAFSKLNGGNPVASPTLGTKAVRDVSIIGNEEGRKWYIIGTDLDIDTTNWDSATRNGSRGIFVWESTDLVNWGNHRLVTVEDETAGMVWAPDAIWDESQGQYLVHWASRLYAESDTAHSGDPVTADIIRYAYTSDFETFSEPRAYIDRDTGVIDLSFLKVDDNTYVRFYVDESIGATVTDISTNGIFGDWKRIATVASSYEGPYPFWDNVVDGKAHLISDLVGGSPGISGFDSTDVESGSWTKNSTVNLTFMRHGSVLTVTQEQYDALAAL